MAPGLSINFVLCLVSWTPFHDFWRARNPVAFGFAIFSMTHFSIFEPCAFSCSFLCFFDVLLSVIFQCLISRILACPPPCIYTIRRFLKLGPRTHLRNFRALYVFVFLCVLIVVCCFCYWWCYFVGSPRSRFWGVLAALHFSGGPAPISTILAGCQSYTGGSPVFSVKVFLGSWTPLHASWRASSPACTPFPYFLWVPGPFSRVWVRWQTCMLVPSCF